MGRENSGLKNLTNDFNKLFRKRHYGELKKEQGYGLISKNLNLKNVKKIVKI